MEYEKLFAAGFLINIVASIYMIIQMFRVKWWWGILGILIPFSALVFLYRHWDMAKRPFFINLPGLALIIIALALEPDKPLISVNLNEGLPVLIKEEAGWKAMVNEREKPSHLYMINKSLETSVHFYTYLKSYFESLGISVNVKDISKVTFANVQSLYTNINIETEIERSLGQWQCYEVIFSGLFEGDRVKGSFLVINANEYLITVLFQSPEDSYISNKNKFEGLLRSIKTDDQSLK